MRARSLLLIAAIVILPLAALSWAGVRLAQDEQVAVQQRFEDLMERRLHDVNSGIERHFDQLERRLRQFTQIDDYDIGELRQRTRTEPLLLQLFVLDAKGDLLYPNPADALNGGEESFLLRASRMFTDHDLVNAVQKDDAAETGDSQNRAAQSSTVVLPSEQLQQEAEQQSDDLGDRQALPPEKVRYGWFVWFWDRGQNLIYWQRRPSGHIVGAALERARWMADLVAVLPETQPVADNNSTADQSPIRLLNSHGDVVYQWGGRDESGNDAATCEISVAAPIASWRLQCPISSAALAIGAGRSYYVNLIGGLIAAATALCGLGVWLYRDYSRDMRNAAQQVSFVNQVSHELKTPLTNIRMYAELLESELADRPQHDRSRQRLAVITGEAQRLSRLIGNVLTFAMQERGTLNPQSREVAIQKLINQIVDRFRPTLESHGITPCVKFDLCSGSKTPDPGTALKDQVMIDPDFLEQILGNLINNVERYAADGGELTVSTTRQSEMIILDVIDAGPGISASRIEDVFRPFTRLSNAIDQPAGTGIGLSIARDLARRHGGDLQLIPSTNGCHFRLTLKYRPAA
jgi:signal transduction histidine kinase